MDVNNDKEYEIKVDQIIKECKKKIHILNGIVFMLK